MAIVLMTFFKHNANALLDVKMRHFLDRKKQLHLLDLSTSRKPTKFFINQLINQSIKTLFTIGFTLVSILI